MYYQYFNYLLLLIHSTNPHHQNEIGSGEKFLEECCNLTGANENVDIFMMQSSLPPNKVLEITDDKYAEGSTLIKNTPQEKTCLVTNASCGIGEDKLREELGIDSSYKHSGQRNCSLNIKATIETEFRDSQRPVSVRAESQKNESTIFSRKLVKILTDILSVEVIMDLFEDIVPITRTLQIFSIFKTDSLFKIQNVPMVETNLSMKSEVEEKHFSVPNESSYKNVHMRHDNKSHDVKSDSKNSGSISSTFLVESDFEEVSILENEYTTKNELNPGKDCHSVSNVHKEDPYIYPLFNERLSRKYARKEVNNEVANLHSAGVNDTIQNQHLNTKDSDVKRLVHNLQGMEYVLLCRQLELKKKLLLFDENHVRGLVQNISLLIEKIKLLRNRVEEINLAELENNILTYNDESLITGIATRDSGPIMKENTNNTTKFEEFEITQSLRVNSSNQLVTDAFLNVCGQCAFCIAVANKLNETFSSVFNSAALGDLFYINLGDDWCAASFKSDPLEVHRFQDIVKKSFYSEVIDARLESYIAEELLERCNLYRALIPDLRLYYYWQNNNFDMIKTLCRSDYGIDLRSCIPAFDEDGIFLC